MAPDLSKLPAKIHTSFSLFFSRDGDDDDDDADQ
jgi:hypothetical protein